MVELSRIAIYDGRTVIQYGLAALVQSAFLEAHVHAADSLAAIRTKMADPQIIIVGSEQTDVAPKQIANILRTEMPSARLLCLLDQPDQIWTAIRSDWDGYGLTAIAADDLASGLRSLQQGHCFFDSGISHYLLREEGWMVLRETHRRQNARKFAELSPRETDVLQLIADGRDNKDIAHTLGLSVQTVKVHVKNILKKLHVPDRTNAAILFVGERPATRIVRPSPVSARRSAGR